MQGWGKANMSSNRRLIVYLIVFSAMVVAILLIALRSCVSETKDEITASAFNDDSIVELRDGSTIVAERGSLGREMVDWLGANPSGEASFLLAGEPFQPDSAVPAADGWGRTTRFIAMMRANPDVKAQIVVFATKSRDSEATQLASERARRLQSELVTRGVSASRLVVEGRPAPDVGRGTSIENGRIAITLSRS